MPFSRMSRELWPPLGTLLLDAQASRSLRCESLLKL